MDKNKKIAIGFYMVAICFYIAVAIAFLNKSSGNTMGIVFLCLGSSWVALGGSFSNKHKKNEDDNQ